SICLPTASPALHTLSLHDALPISTTLPSITHDVPLVGAAGLRVVQRQARAIGARYGWDRPRMDHLLHRYGSLLQELTDLCDERRSEEHTSELQSRENLVCRLLLEK